jgi:hypothetical protein
MEMESLKADNERLIALLKNTCEYADTNFENLQGKSLQGARAI